MVSSLYDENKDSNKRPSLTSLVRVFKHLLTLSQEKFIVIDALDECGEQGDLLDILLDIWKVRSQDVHILVTSRPELSITETLEPILTNKLSLTNSAIEDDIALHIHKQVSHHPKLKRWEKAIRRKIEKILKEKAQGM